MKPARGLPIPAIVALAAALAGLIGVWRGLTQSPVETPSIEKLPIASPLVAPVSERPRPEPTVGVLGGVVRLADGAPAAGAKVTGHVSSYVGRPSLQAPLVPKDIEIVADAQGQFTFEVSLNWAWTLKAQKDALVGLAVDVVPPEAKVVIALGGAQSVKVTVREKSGQGVASVPVGMTGEGQHAPAFEGLTDSAGRLTFERVPVGRWRVDAVENVIGKASDGKPVSRERRRAQAMVDLQAAAAGEAVLEFGSVGKIRGKVTAPAGVDLAQLSVFGVPSTMAKAMQTQVYGAQMELLPRAYPSTRVAADGRFELLEVSGAQGLIVPHPTLIQSVVVAQPDGPEAVVALFKDKAVKGKVVDPSGKPVPKFSVNGAAFESPEGLFEYVPGGLPGAERPKAMPLIVTADGFAPLEKQLTLGAGDTDVGTLQLQAGRTLTLKVVEEQGGAPVDELTFVRLDGTGLTSEPAERLSPGVYRFSRLPSTPVTLSMTRFGGASRKLQVAPGDTEKTFRFGAGATVRGVVIGETGKPAVGARIFPAGDLRATRVTDLEGKFSFPGLEPGEITLAVTFGRSSKVKKVLVPESGEVELRIDLSEQ